MVKKDINVGHSGNYACQAFFLKKWVIFLRWESESLIKSGLKIPRSYRKIAEENQTASWVIMNGNRVQIKRKQFEKIIDSLDVI